MSKGVRIGSVLAGTAWLSMTGFAAQAQDIVDQHFQSHALRYAAMVERAYGRLNGHIRVRSDEAVSWSGAAVPPASTGWEAVWTEAGLRARYCDDVLVVYLDPSEVKGVGGAHRAIQQARRSFLPERERGVKLPLLSWLEAGEVVDAHGNVRTLPPCMTGSYSEPLPSGRAALAGDVVDPSTDVREQVSYENTVQACAAGEHGEVRRRRTVTKTFDGRGEEVGSPVYGPWEEAPGSWCRSDYTYYEVFTRPCRWYQGEPFDREMEGTETWRAPVRVSADPDAPAGGSRRTPGASELVSSTCWGTPPGAVPVPVSNHESFTETRNLSCPAGMSGRVEVARQRTTTTTTYPWGEDPLVAVDYTNWNERSNTCSRIPQGGGNGGNGGGGDNGGSGGNEGGGGGLSGVGGGGPSGTPGVSGNHPGAFGGPGNEGGPSGFSGPGGLDSIGGEGWGGDSGASGSGDNSAEIGNSGDAGIDGGFDGAAWFCFSEHAGVHMATGAVQVANTVDLGDLLASANGSARVVAVYRDSREKEWVSINGRAAFFTVDHPVMTGRGMVPGGELRRGDRVKRFDGGWEDVRAVHTAREHRVSINIETEERRPFYVEGLMFGVVRGMVTDEVCGYVQIPFDGGGGNVRTLRNRAGYACAFRSGSDRRCVVSEEPAGNEETTRSI